MQQKSLFSGRNRDMLNEVRDTSPLRSLFLKNKDLALYETITKYFMIVDEIYWKRTSHNSYIFKTVGIQALFDVLKTILRNENIENIENINFYNYLIKATNIDFTDKFFQSSGIGRGRIRNSINVMIGLLDKSKIKKKDLSSYELIFEKKATAIEKEKWIWEEEAENDIINLLENSTWSYESKTVSLYLDNEYEQITVFRNYEEFRQKLIEVAESTFVNYLPSDREFADEQLENFDSEDLVDSLLFDYEVNLKRIGWQ